MPHFCPTELSASLRNICRPQQSFIFTMTFQPSPFWVFWELLWLGLSNYLMRTISLLTNNVIIWCCLEQTLENPFLLLCSVYRPPGLSEVSYSCLGSHWKQICVARNPCLNTRCRQSQGWFPGWVGRQRPFSHFIHPITVSTMKTSR